MVSWLVILTVFLPWLGGLVVWACRDSRPRLQHGLASGFALASAVAALALLPLATDKVVLSVAVGGVFGDFTLAPNGFGVLLAVIATVVGSLAVVFSIDYMRGEDQLGRYYSLILLFIGAMAGLVLSASLLFMFFFWEITAFCSYALISFHNDDPKAVAGGIKALIMTQVGGAGLLAGALIALAYLNSYQISVFLNGTGSLPPAALALIAFGFLAAAIAKSAQIPLHTWLPDAMEAPTPVTALIHAATMVNAGVYLLARFYPALAPVPGWKAAVMIAGLLSALLAAIMAITAVDLKRALAYSTISQLGYMFYAVGAGAIFASQFHLFSHALFKGLLFLGAGSVIHAVGTRDMRRMGGLGKQMPFVCAVFIIGALALAGIPLTTGFFSKELLLEEGLDLGPLWAFVFMVIGAGLTALYAIRMVAMVFFGPSGKARSAHDAGRAMRISLALLAFGALVAWIAAGPISKMFAATLPDQQIHSATTVQMVGDILAEPATWLALVVVALGVVAWLLRGRLVSLTAALEPLIRPTQSDLGFEWLNRQIIRLFQRFSGVVCSTQTGQLNWNVAGIVGALVLLLALLLMEAR
jgi:NADH-quinone oxidoreductase subunit L